MSTKQRHGRTTPASPPDVARRRGFGPWPRAAAGLLALAAVLAVLAVILLPRWTAEIAATPSPSIIIGTAGGVVISQGTPSAAPTVESSTPSVAPTDAPAATPGPATPPPPTPPATVAAPPPIPTPAPTTAPQPTTVALAVAGPADAVGAFYAHVVAGSFDAAYSFWSDRMRAAYPRQENLDQRFDETAGIEFQQLFVAEQAGDRATAQANFTETYDSGASRQFIGYWRLVRVDGRWLLDEPRY